MNDKKPLLALTLGDPSGVGPEVVVKALADPEINDEARMFVAGTERAVNQALSETGIDLSVELIESPADTPDTIEAIPVLSVGDFEDVEFPQGKHSADSGRASHLWVETSAKMCLAGEIDAMVTAPVNKESWQISGALDLGHQEVFKRLTNSATVYTMLVSGILRCMHLSTHKSLPEACAFVTTDNILTAVRITDDHFRRWGFDEPRVAVAALNPHASDNGLIGDTEAKEISPAIEMARSEGINATGPHPADSVFNQAIDGIYDVVVVMYHDQGHIPIKVHGFEESVSVNLGIPFIRTSVDHGTAFDIAGKNLAQSTSMVEAIKLAIALATRRGIA
ncbi:MAG: 4-hydroxythreonine-4-phosphate dehydrogenase PdxA [Chloroflexi bacterium]|nr:4-hydroxythreonine-4-phosphate dehydrogenase PdxA [Chloroflexota bacterium]